MAWLNVEFAFDGQTITVQALFDLLEGDNPPSQLAFGLVPQLGDMPILLLQEKDGSMLIATENSGLRCAPLLTCAGVYFLNGNNIYGYHAMGGTVPQQTLDIVTQSVGPLDEVAVIYAHPNDQEEYAADIQFLVEQGIVEANIIEVWGGNCPSFAINVVGSLGF